MNVRNKREREKKTVTEMITLYCHGHHQKKGVCPDCQELIDYACHRSDVCPFMENKTFCINCKVHCYQPEMRSKIQKVMRWAGPRMIFHHPIMALRHLYEMKKERGNEQ